MSNTLPGRPTKWRPTGLSDSLDGTNSFDGAMSVLSNLVPSPNMRGAWVPRPASAVLTSFAGLTSPAQGTALLQVGVIAYGMIAETSGAYAGKDVPFAFNTKTGAFETITIPGGADSLPTTQSNSGDWTPPSMAQVGSRVVITHPGYPGAAGPFFGWLDVSGFDSTTITGSTHSNKTLDTLSFDVLQAGWQPGQLIAGTGIPANTTIVSIAQSNLDLNTTADIDQTNQLTSVADLTGVVVGAGISGVGIPLGTLVQSLPGGGVVVMTQAATSTATGVGINFAGSTSLTLSQAATATATGVALTVTGGTASAPLYGSGNTNINPLPTVPVAVANFNGRAYYACPKNGLKFSDDLLPCNVTSPTQGLNPGNGLDFNALGGLPEVQTLGGILQALIAFQGQTGAYQVTGDQATSNLSLNLIGTGVGTLAPNTLCQTPLGLAFIAQDGLRIVQLNGTFGDVIGENGSGVCVPFINAVNPTRMCAAFNQNTLRVSVQNGNAAGQPTQEFWYNFALKTWSGPHSFPAALIVPYQGSPNRGFTMFDSVGDAKLWSSSAAPSDSDEYVENGALLNWQYQTVLLPDNGGMSENKMVQTTLTCAIANQQQMNIQVETESGTVLDNVTLFGAAIPPTVWGSFTWGAAPWSGSVSYLSQQTLFWHMPLIFKQASIAISGNSALGTILGNLNMQIEELGYLSQQTLPPPMPVEPPFAFGEGAFGVNPFG